MCDANATCSSVSYRHIARMTDFLVRSALPAFILCSLATPALAGSSEWAKVEGGAVRVVTEGLPDADGDLRGALEIRLEPGWKTYWRDPGESGIPPSVNVLEPSGGTNVDIGFPAPQRFNDGYSIWAGYDEPVSLALDFDLPDGAAPDQLNVSVFLGICEVICIPVQAEFGINLTDSSNALPDRNSVEAAFAALPKPASPEFGAVLTDVGEDKLVIEVSLPGSISSKPTLFVASTANWAFDVPQPGDGANGGTFAVPVLIAPEAGAPADTIHYTLVAGDDAVSGTLDIAR